jgi:hypothetical protein
MRAPFPRVRGDDWSLYQNPATARSPSPLETSTAPVPPQAALEWHAANRKKGQGHTARASAPRWGRPIADWRCQGHLVFNRALVIGQEVFGAEDAFEVEPAAGKIGLAAFTRPEDKPPAPIYADILRGGSSSSGNGQT